LASSARFYIDMDVRVCKLRCKGDTQEETRNVAWELYDLAKEKFPVSWEALFYANI